jgi:signal transduction histidine kinase
MRFLLRYLLGTLFGALLAVGANAQDALHVLAHGDIVLSDSAEPPPDSAAWQPVSLPDFWPRTRPGVFGTAWYRLRFELRTQPEQPQAVMTARLSSVGAVVVNGRLVGQNGEWGQVPGRRSSGLVLYPFDASLLRAGENTVYIRLWAPARRDCGCAYAKLAGVRLGDKAAVVQAYEHERFLFVTVTQMAGVFSLTIGIGTLLIWLQRRREEVFGYFCIGALSMGLVFFQALGWLEWAPQPITAHVLWFFLLGPGQAAMFVYCLRFAGWRWPRTERAVWLLTALTWLIDESGDLIGHALPGSEANPLFGMPLWELSFAAQGVLMAYVWYRKPGLDSALLTLAHVYSTVALAWEILHGNLGGVDVRITHMIPLFFVMGWIITRRFGRSLTDAERLNAELERRVEVKRAEIASNAEHVQALTRQQALADERRRIMSDMHDGIGGQLISALSLVDAGDASKEQVAAALRECIDDLRLAIDSLEPTEEDLLPVLGGLRYRLEPRLKAQGIALDWQVQEVPRLACLTPQNVLHVLRILQEAFTNTLKHAKASRIRVATAVQAGRVAIDLSDDGDGFDTRGARGGHGLANMRRRAAAIGAELMLRSSHEGTTLSLLLPAGP